MKYKEGQKVRIIGLRGFQDGTVSIGDIVTVIMEHPSGNDPHYTIRTSRGKRWWVRDIEIELYEEEPKMQKYTTEPIDYTGCHPVIADHLKRGEAILCRVRDSCGDWKTDFRVGGYCAKATYRYFGSFTEGGIASCFIMAEPIVKTRKALISPEKAVVKLIENGWVFRSNSELTNKPAGLSIAIYDLRRLQGQDQDVCTNFYPDYLFEEVD